VPDYYETYQSESSLNKATTAFQENVVLDSSDCILTNSNHHAWNILAYYYPEASVRNVSDGNFDVDTNDKDIWIFWTSELSEDVLEYYEGKEELCTLMYQGKLGNSSTLWVYKVEK
jgi:hypothetical protein